MNPSPAPTPPPPPAPPPARAAASARTPPPGPTPPPPPEALLPPTPAPRPAPAPEEPPRAPATETPSLEPDPGDAARPPETAKNPETISAIELHQMLLRAYRLGAVLRVRFLSGLLALHESALYLQLGSPSTHEYASRHFGFGRSETYEYIRVARALEVLPLSAQAFEEGKLSWSALKEIARVADAESEAEWLEVAAKGPFETLRAEVQDAVRNRRRRPRERRYGLPGLPVRLQFVLEPAEYALLSEALERAAKEVAESLGVSSVKPKDALVYLAARVVEGRLLEREGAPAEGEGARSPYAVLFRKCPDCLASHVKTPEGYAEVDPEVVERVEGDAERVEIAPEEEIPAGAAEAEIPASEPEAQTPASEPEEIPASGPEAARGPRAKKDRPTPPSLSRKLFLREGGTCGNPRCGRKGPLHSHHVRFRSEGGKTAAWNEVLLCARCHALVHLGLLLIQGDPLKGFEFIAVAAEPRLDFESELRELARIPRVQVAGRGGGGSEGGSGDLGARGPERRPGKSEVRGSGGNEAGAAPAPRALPRGPVAALETLGYSRTEAKRRVEAACEELLREARAKAEREGGPVPADAAALDETAVIRRAIAARRAAPVRAAG